MTVATLTFYDVPDGAGAWDAPVEIRKEGGKYRAVVPRPRTAYRMFPPPTLVLEPDDTLLDALRRARGVLVNRFMVWG